MFAKLSFRPALCTVQLPGLFIITSVPLCVNRMRKEISCKHTGGLSPAIRTVNVQFGACVLMRYKNLLPKNCAEGSSKALESVYQTTRRHNPERCNLNLQAQI